MYQIAIPLIEPVIQSLDRVRKRVCTNAISESTARSVALQVALVDVLNAVGIQAAGLSSSGTGAIARDYASGKCSRDQAIETAFQQDAMSPKMLSVETEDAASSSCGYSSGDDEEDEQTGGSAGSGSESSRTSSRSSCSSGSAGRVTRIRIGGQSGIQITGEDEGERQQMDVCLQLLTTLGRLHQLGLPVNADVLYPSVEWPVPASTPFLAPLIHFDHRIQQDLSPFLHDKSSAYAFQTTKNLVFRFDASRSEDVFLFDHKIDGRTLFPATGYLMIAWSAFATQNRQVAYDFGVRFEDVHFHRATVMRVDEETCLSVRINEDSGSFEICPFLSRSFLWVPAPTREGHPVTD